MRVIAGSKRRLLLKTVEGMGTRPTTDRIKETLFNMINDELPGTVFLDIFAGSGQIGIEGLSRGCKYCYFIENNKKAVECINDNLASTGLMESAKVLPMDYAQGLNRIVAKNSIDVVFMDPPYNQEIEKDVLTKLKSQELLADRALIIVEASLDTDFSYVEDLGYVILKEKNYKTNKHLFLEESK